MPPTLTQTPGSTSDLSQLSTGPTATSLTLVSVSSIPPGSVWLTASSVPTTRFNIFHRQTGTPEPTPPSASHSDSSLPAFPELYTPPTPSTLQGANLRQQTAGVHLCKRRRAVEFMISFIHHSWRFLT
ncbi:hypothetical protein M407DRAFT_20811 [Tulasnella calospora MUT 4182]|uniref:Uncharacterized protein n=1 Tax=Tulasnella calospora MUT 4182 TaxID=1051891 RepID=A0A0C3L8J1_9AGAM|nr:hypothetical protein M407DRAFT_20811 [Tulasnella calospora MUT 4182]